MKTQDKKSEVKTGNISLLNKLENYLQTHENIYFWIIFAVTGIVSLLLYDPRVSLTGDDSGYILGANGFIKDFSFPSSQAALYMIALSPVTYFFGLALFPMKLFSMLSMLGFIYFTYRAFRKKIPAIILLPVLALLSTNSYVLYYASQTFSEAFYMFMQSVFIYVFFHFLVKNQAESENTGWSKQIKVFLLVALAALGVALTRPIGFTVVIAAAVYFLFYKEWKNLGLLLVSFAILYLAFSLLKECIWGNEGDQLASKAIDYWNKNPYKAEEGTEDFKGILVRFWQNSQQYLSNGLFRIMGFKTEPGSNSVFRTLVVFAIALGSLFLSFKRNKPLFFSILLTGVFLVATFIILHVFWNQERLIIPVYSYMLMSIFVCLYYLVSTKKGAIFQFLYPVLFGLLFILALSNTIKAIPEARKLTNQYSGLTPDWRNYLKASEWASKNLKETDVVAVRKPTMSVLYGNGKSFYGIYSVPTDNAGAFLQEWTAAPDKYLAVPIDNNSFSRFDLLREAYFARLETGNYAFWILNRSDNTLNVLSQTGIPGLTLPQMQDVFAQTNNEFGIFHADSLLNRLREGNVTHLMTANLRIDPAHKTGQTVSTVERYAYYISEKYPEIFRFVYQEGTDDNEPANIYLIDWQQIDSRRK